MMHNFGLISRGARGVRGARGFAAALVFLHNIPPLDEPVKGARKDNVSNDDEGQHGNMII